MQEILLKTTWMEWLGVSFAIVQVLLAQKNNIHNYLFGIAGILLALYVKFNAKLYAEFSLDLYYLVMSIYGWIFWKFGKQQTETPITFATSSEKYKTAGIVIGAFVIFYTFLTQFTDSDVPFWDSIVTAFAWAGMWLMAKRKIENWVLLNISNIISIPLLIHKDLYLYAALSAFLFIVAIFGYINWNKILKTQKHA
ncbi:nicotinamide mononucleotide transporter [Flavobacterium sp. xlx-214]|uniref:nicotinamide riboside transporter PnuC n=1 Tax=unclassified Flavobacterium TaxID=196869 RepID=UPI0013D1676C|nr:MULTISPECIES: nicotinamide riboside transporter PnuC [unclassified Flavobacterium]MBA5792034.1 nicotinamide mononucleotide transporter [Flavobacterium sp. xlx-221]QMI84286.1 nicotinamide mononucleotide transporter [Flavobacterium sp. xlx-214]